MTDHWYTGNAADDGSERRGWILGHFIDPSEGVRHSKDVEVKWGTHPAGETRPEWAPDDQRTTLVMLIQGNSTSISPTAAPCSSARATTSCGDRA